MIALCKALFERQCIQSMKYQCRDRMCCMEKQAFVIVFKK